MEVEGFVVIARLHGRQDTLWKLWERKIRKGFLMQVEHIISRQDVETWNKGPAHGMPVRMSGTTRALIQNPDLTDDERIGLMRDLYESVEHLARQQGVGCIEMERKG